MKGLSEKDEILLEGFRKCKEITRKYGTSYFFAMRFFPKEMRDAVYAIYAFARIPDEIVDDPQKTSREQSIRDLKSWRQKWIDAIEQGTHDDPVLAAISHVFHKYEIPVEDGEAFLASMFMDEEKCFYENYQELEKYMYGSAGVIGLMVTRIVGYSSKDAFPYAIKLGYAFQLTNFLRDIKEDYEELDRIYMPADELRAYGLSANDLRNQHYGEKFQAFMKFQIERNLKIYREALPGIKMLNWRGRLAVRTAYVLYKAILTEVERVNHNVFLGRVHTNTSQKVWLTLKSLVGVYE